MYCLKGGSPENVICRNPGGPARDNLRRLWKPQNRVKYGGSFKTIKRERNEYISNTWKCVLVSHYTVDIKYELYFPSASDSCLHFRFTFFFIYIHWTLCNESPLQLIVLAGRIKTALIHEVFNWQWGLAMWHKSSGEYAGVYFMIFWASKWSWKCKCWCQRGFWTRTRDAEGGHNSSHGCGCTQEKQA